VLDTLIVTHGSGWCAASNGANQYIDIDAGKPMQISGVVTQGRGNAVSQYSTRIRVEYKLLQYGEYVRIHGHFVTSWDTVESKFPTDVYARYIRIRIMAWQGHICVRAACWSTRFQSTKRS